MKNLLTLGLGANLGDREETLRRAGALLEERLGPLVDASRLHETDPVVLPGDDPASMPKFLNAVFVFETGLSPREVLGVIRDVEHELGRRRELETRRWQPRYIDIDLLTLGAAIVDEPDLKVPHPELQNRLFVLEPLAEAAPKWRHPVLRKSARELIAALQDSGGAEQSLAHVL